MNDHICKTLGGGCGGWRVWRVEGVKKFNKKYNF